MNTRFRRLHTTDGALRLARHSPIPMARDAMLNAIPNGEVLAPGTVHTGSGVTVKNTASSGPSIEGNSPITTSRRLAAEALDPGNLIDPGTCVSGVSPAIVSTMGPWLEASARATREALERIRANAARLWAENPVDGGAALNVHLVATNAPRTVASQPSTVGRDAAVARGTTAAADARASADQVAAINERNRAFWAVRA